MRTDRWSRPLAGVVLIGLLFGCGGLPSGEGRKSQPALLKQRVGATEITVVYNRPSARGRQLFGGIVPFGEVWNPGADEATRIEFDQDVRFGGQPVRAGKYSIWAIPEPNEWTIILSTAADVFHVPYPEGRDALRLRVRPVTAPHMETMAFYFPVAAEDSAVLNFHWGETVVAIPIRLQ